MFGGKYKRKDWGRLDPQELVGAGYDRSVARSEPVMTGPFDVMKCWEYIGPAKRFRVWKGVAFLGSLVPTEEWVEAEDVPGGLRWSGRFLRRGEEVPLAGLAGDSPRPRSQKARASAIRAVLDQLSDTSGPADEVACVARLSAFGATAVPVLASALDDIPSCLLTGAVKARFEVCVCGLAGLGAPGIEALRQYLDSPSSPQAGMVAAVLVSYATSGRPYSGLADELLRGYFSRNPDEAALHLAVIQQVRDAREGPGSMVRLLSQAAGPVLETAVHFEKWRTSFMDHLAEDGDDVRTQLTSANFTRVRNAWKYLEPASRLLVSSRAACQEQGIAWEEALRGFPELQRAERIVAPYLSVTNPEELRGEFVAGGEPAGAPRDDPASGKGRGGEDADLHALSALGDGAVASALASGNVPDRDERGDSMRLAAARWHLQRGEVARGEELLREICSRCPERYEPEFVEDGRRYVRGGDTVTAALLGAAAGEKASGMDTVWLQPVYPSACYQLGFLLFERKELEEAVRWLAEGCRMEPDNATLLLELGNAHAALKQHEEALACFSRASLLSGLNPAIEAAAYRRMGISQIDLGRFDDAEANLLKALSLDPNEERTRDELQFVIGLKAGQGSSN